MSGQFRYLAYLDILGFKDLIEHNTLDAVEELYEELERGLCAGVNFYGQLNVALEKKNLPNLEEIEYNHLNSLIVSDSIVLWTDDGETKSFSDLVFAVQMILGFALEFGIPLRGAITSGELSIKTGNHKKSTKLNLYNTILGKPLTKAYIIESSSEWSGCIVDSDTIDFVTSLEQKFEETLSGKVTLSVLEFVRSIVHYVVPMKTGGIKECATINWTNSEYLQLNENKIREKFNMHNKNTNDWAVESKIMNTIEYFEKVNKGNIEFRKLVELSKKG